MKAESWALSWEMLSHVLYNNSGLIIVYIFYYFLDFQTVFKDNRVIDVS